MGLTSAQDTPQQQIQKSGLAGGRIETPNTPTPSNFLDTIRKPNHGTGLKEHERVRIIYYQFSVLNPTYSDCLDCG